MSKINKIIVAVLVLIGFGSCCKRPAKSQAGAGDSSLDSVTVRPFDRVPDVRVMYGNVRPVFDPDKIKRVEIAVDSTAVKEPSPNE